MDYRLYAKTYASQRRWEKVVGGVFSKKEIAKKYGERAKQRGVIAKYKVVPVKRKRRRRS